MTHTKNCSRALLLIFGLCLGSSPRVQQADSALHDPVTRAVVQLLAICPGGIEKNRESGGTGFFVNEEGFILTNAHVFEEAQRCLVRAPGAKILAKLSKPGARTATAVSCDLVGLDDLHDLAVIKVERSPLADSAGEQPPFLLLDTSELPLGTHVAVSGHPLFAWVPVTQSGEIIGRESLRVSDTNLDPTEVLVLNIPLRPGNSGSPVYLAEANSVVGIVEQQEPLHPSQTVAVPVHYAIELLNRHSVRWHTSQK